MRSLIFKDFFSSFAFSSAEQLVLPTFVPKSLQNFQQLEKRTKPTETESTLIELTKLIDENKLEKKIDRLSRFLNAEILNKKPTIGQLKSSTIDLTETKKLFVFRLVQIVLLKIFF